MEKKTKEKIYDFRTPYQKATDERRMTIIKLWEEKCKSAGADTSNSHIIAEIAEKVGVTRQCVYVNLRNIGILDTRKRAYNSTEN